MISYRLRQARINAELTQDQLGDLVRASKAEISRWETGAREPRLDRFADICRALDVSADDILDV